MDGRQCCLLEDCQGKYEKRNKFLIKCSSSNNLIVPAGITAGTTYIVASLDLDLACFCNPSVNLEFSSNILSLISFIEIDFQVFRQCKNELSPTAVSSIWTYNSLTPGSNSSTFTFLSCDCDLSNCSCCTYTVVATIRSTVEANPATVNNAMLDAFVTENFVC